MEVLRCRAKILRDGHLSLPKTLKEKLLAWEIAEVMVEISAERERYAKLRETLLERPVVRDVEELSRALDVEDHSWST